MPQFQFNKGVFYTTQMLCAVFFTFFSSCNLFLMPPPPLSPPVPIDATFLQIEQRQLNQAGFKLSYEKFNKTIQNKIDSAKAIGREVLPFEVTRIPVVIHVIQSNGSPSITQPQIEKQIASLTKDFRRADTSRIGQTPLAFRLLAADARVEFVLAKSTLEGEATNGIVYYQSNRTMPFTFSPLASSPQERNPVKFTSSGGADAWPTQSYLNIWICNLSSDLGRGYASLPVDLEGMPAEDGVVVSASDFSKSKTLTPLVAKWLGLNDIWGMGSTVGSDEVADTPSQTTSNNNCPSYPVHNSLTTPYGDMYVNFMDATDDDCRSMFTAGQVDRMTAVLETYRSEITADLYTKAPLSSINCGALSLSDHYVRDFDTSMGASADDLGGEPSALTGNFNNSPSIRVHKGPLFSSWPHTDPTLDGIARYVCVRVFRRCGFIVPNDSIFVYFAKAATVPDWNTNIWSEVKVGVNPAKDRIGIVSPYKDFSFQWGNLPPTTGPCSIIASITKFCSSCTSQNTYDFVRNKNNAALKNISILPAVKDSLARVVININNPIGYNPRKRLRFAQLTTEASVLDFGTLTISNDTLIQLWLKSGRKGKGTALDSNQLLIQEKDAYIDLDIPPGTSMSTTFTFKRSAQASKQRNIYVLNLEQLSSNDGNNYRPEGGFMFVVKTEHTNDFPPAPDLPPTTGGLNGKALAGLAGLLGLLAVLWTQRKKIFGIKDN